MKMISAKTYLFLIFALTSVLFHGTVGIQDNVNHCITISIVPSEKVIRYNVHQDFKSAHFFDDVDHAKNMFYHYFEINTHFGTLYHNYVRSIINLTEGVLSPSKFCESKYHSCMIKDMIMTTDNNQCIQEMKQAGFEHINHIERSFEYAFNKLDIINYPEHTNVHLYMLHIYEYIKLPNNFYNVSKFCDAEIKEYVDHCKADLQIDFMMDKKNDKSFNNSVIYAILHKRKTLTQTLYGRIFYHQLGDNIEPDSDMKPPSKYCHITYSHVESDLNECISNLKEDEFNMENSRYALIHGFYNLEVDANKGRFTKNYLEYLTKHFKIKGERIESAFQFCEVLIKNRLKNIFINTIAMVST